MATVTQDPKVAGSPGYVRMTPVEALPPPVAVGGALGWLRANLFSSPLNILLTLATAALVLWIVPPILNFMIFDAVWSGNDREACLATAQRPEVGACWAFVRDRFFYFIYRFHLVLILTLGSTTVTGLKSPNTYLTESIR